VNLAQHSGYHPPFPFSVTTSFFEHNKVPAAFHSARVSPSSTRRSSRRQSVKRPVCGSFIRLLPPGRFQELVSALLPCGRLFNYPSCEKYQIRDPSAREFPPLPFNGTLQRFSSVRPHLNHRLRESSRPYLFDDPFCFSPSTVPASPRSTCEPEVTLAGSVHCFNLPFPPHKF